MDIADILFIANEQNIKEAIRNNCKIYETDNRYRILRIFENGKLNGFCVISDYNGIRVLSEAHYIGTNKYITIKMWKWATKDAKECRVSILKNNIRMIDFFKRRNFKIVEENEFSVFMQGRL